MTLGEAAGARLAAKQMPCHVGCGPPAPLSHDDLEYPSRAQRKMERRVQLGFPPLSPAVKWLLVALAAIFVVQLAVSAVLEFDLARYDRAVLRTVGLSLDGVLGGFVWQPITYAFVHSVDGIGHLLFNGVALYIFGAWLEPVIGTRRFVRFYLLGGLVAALAVLLVDLVAHVALGSAGAPTVGASGAISAVVGAFCRLNWDRWLDMVITRFKGWHLLALFVGIDLVRALLGSEVSVSAHLGGLAFGVLWFDDRFTPRRLWAKARLWYLRRKLRVLTGRDPDEMVDPERYMN